MAYGIELRNFEGTLFFSTALQTWNYIGSFITPVYNGSNYYTSYLIPGANLLTEYAVQLTPINSPPDTLEAYLPTITVYLSSQIVYSANSNTQCLVVILGR
jgi:hypothetical protein